MTSSRFMARVCVFALALSSPLAAQTVMSAGPIQSGVDPAQSLAENLKALARDPYNVDALVQAGIGALAVGDPNAAFGFFARAEELSPSNARAKAGLGSALTMMEKPRDGLRAFEEATSLGILETVIFADRGLAYDLSGDAKRAQKDYLAALKSAPSEEVTRRLALSLGISGEKEAALARLDPLIRRNDQAAWRARAFILAMNGDSSGAEKIVRMVAPAGTASSMVNFMQRLAGLGPAARASAVHFGTLPASGTGLASVATADDFRPLDSSSAARLTAPSVDRTAVVPTAPLSAKEARRKAREDEKLAKLAAKGREASQKGEKPAAVVRATPPEVAARVAAVMPAASDRAVILQGAKELPLPDAVAARASSVGNATPSAPKIADARFTAPSATAAPAPLFEVPAPAPKPSTPVVTAPTTLSASGVSPSTVGPATLTQSPTLVTPTPSPSSVSPGTAPITTAPSLAPPAAAPAIVKPVELPPAQVAQQPAATGVTQPAAVVSAPTVELATSSPGAMTQTVPVSDTPATTVPMSAPAAAPIASLADIVRTLELEQESAAAPLPDEAQLRAARLAAQKKAAADQKLKAEKLAEEKRVAEEDANARRNPARIWVQIATGNNRSGLPGTWRKLKEQASKSLARQTPWTLPFRQTNRLLVGPLKSVGEARELVNSLAKEGVQATTFSSEAGQEISRIGGK